MTDNPASGDSLPMIPPTGFDLGFGPAAPPNVTTPLSIAQAVVSGLQGQLRTHVTNEFANAAVTTDLLSNKLQVPIQQTLGDAAQVLVRLQHPIATQIAGDLGSTMEAATRLGAVPPSPQTVGTMPAAVQIRQSALHGDFGPALEAYRTLALPFRDFPGLQYAIAMQGIMSALPPDQSVQDTFMGAAKGVDIQSAIQPTMPGHPNISYDQCVQNAGNWVDAVTGQAMGTYPQGSQSLLDALASINSQYQVMLQACAPAPGPSLPTAPAVIPGLGGPPGGITGGTVPKPLVKPPVSTTGGGVSPVGGGTLTVPGQLPSGQPVSVSPGQVVPGTPPPGQITAAPPTGVDKPPPGGGDYVPPNVTMGHPPPGAFAPPPALPTPGTPPASAPITPPVGFPPEVSAGLCGAPWTNTNGVSVTPEAVTAAVQSFIDSHPSPADGSIISELVANIQQVLGLTLATAGVGYGLPILDTYFPDAFGWPGIEFYVGVSCAQVSRCCTNPRIVIVCDGDAAPQSQPPASSTTSSTTPAKPTRPTITTAELAGCDEFGTPLSFGSSNQIPPISQLLGLTDKNGQAVVPSSMSSAPAIVQNVFSGLVSLIAGVVDNTGGTFNSLLAASDCQDSAMYGLQGVALMCNLANRFVGDTLKTIETPNRQQRNYKCPTDLPSAADAAVSWLGNTIDVNTLECWVRAAGMRFPEFKTVIDATRAKFPLLQIGSLYLRGELTADQLATRVRELGYTQDSDVSDLRELLKVIPPPTDLVRFMVRDTQDQNIVQTFGLDTDFQLKYGQQLQEWAKASGVSDEYMQNVWRAHWSIPAPGQLMDFLHRSARLPQGDPAAVTIADVKTALEQQDILPYWIPKFINASYYQLGRIDLRRGFALGIINIGDLTKYYNALGYSPDDSDTLSRITSQQTLAALKRNPAVNQFAAGTLSEQDFSQLLQDSGADDNQVAYVRVRALTLARTKSRAACTKSYKRRFLIGDIDAQGAQQNLVQQDIPADVVDTIISGWQCELSAQGKSIPAATLAGLYADGGIDAPGLTARLQRIGYSYEDSVLLTRQIVYRQNQKISKLEQAQIEAQAKLQAKQELDAQKAAAKAAQQLAKQQRQVLAMQRINTTRERRLMEAGGKYQANSGKTLADAVTYVKRLYSRLLSDSTWLPDEIIAAIVAVSGSKAITADADFASAVNVALQGADSSWIAATS